MEFIFQIDVLDRLGLDPNCNTVCGDGGCHCIVTVPNHTIDQYDHLMMLGEDGRSINCICGAFRSEWLPVSLRTWSHVKLIYSIVQYSWSAKGFTFKVSYNFNNDAMCGQKTFTTHSGELTSRNITSQFSLNSFYHQQCTWILDSNVERQLFIEIKSEQSRSCAAWNITIHEYTPYEDDTNQQNSYAGNILHQFCPRDKYKLFTMPWKLNTVVIRVRAMTRTPPEYVVRWRSQIVRANTRLGPPTPAPNAISICDRTYTYRSIHLIFIVFIIKILFGL